MAHKRSTSYTSDEGKISFPAGCLGDNMFSKAPRAASSSDEIIYPGENFRWRQDETATARHPSRKLRTHVLGACLGSMLAIILVGHELGLPAWLISALTALR